MTKEYKNYSPSIDSIIDKLMREMNIDTESGKLQFKKLLLREYQLLSGVVEKKLSFRKATIEKLMEIVDIKRIPAKNKFNKWFDYKYKLSEDETIFLENLIEENELFLTLYNEQTLTVKFIGLILNKVKFSNKGIKDWYGYNMRCKLNNYILNGEPDFTVATGISIPKIPYFFLQEYKKSVNPTGNPEFQVLATMLTAMTLNNTNEIKGGFIIGRTWTFIILEKLENDNYEYFVSDGFDCLRFSDLKQIYINLQAVKFLYCK